MKRKRETVEAIKERGYVSVPDLLSVELLLALRSECDALFKCMTEEDYVETGCAMDFFKHVDLPDTDPARRERDAYEKLRFEAKTVSDKRLISELLFETLPRLVRPLFLELGWEPSSDQIYLFNEQYICKPPSSDITFRWHTDVVEQLSMVLALTGTPPRPYLSIWIALDDCDESNGCLRIYPSALDTHGSCIEEPPEKLSDTSGVSVEAKAGTGVIFTSELWHCSGPNTTDKPRRAFYAQYSREVIAAPVPSSLEEKDSGPVPLCFAIPCS